MVTIYKQRNHERQPQRTEEKTILTDSHTLFNMPNQHSSNNSQSPSHPDKIQIPTSDFIRYYAFAPKRAPSNALQAFSKFIHGLKNSSNIKSSVMFCLFEEHNLRRSSAHNCYQRIIFLHIFKTLTSDTPPLFLPAAPNT